jgi:hypothetical protein
MSVSECRELGKKKSMIFPGQFREIAAVSQEVESQPPVKVDRAFDVLYDNLRNELFGRIDVSAHRRFLSPESRYRQAFKKIAVGV